MKVIKRTALIIFMTFSLLTTAVYAKTIDALEFNHINNNSNLIQKDFATLNYEVKETTSLEDPITDPNFNVMRKKELGKAKAIPLVVGVLILAIAAPLATWYYFSK